MPNVREIMLARAKEPAKVHNMDRIPGLAANAPPAALQASVAAGGGGSRCPSGQVSPCGSPVKQGAAPPMLMEHLARERASVGGGAAAKAAPKGRASPEGLAKPRPPRPRASPGSDTSAAGGYGGNAGPRKASEGRRPRPESDQGSRRQGSEPPRLRVRSVERSREAGVGTEEDRPNSGVGSSASAPRPSRAKARASSVQAPRERVRLGQGEMPPPVDKKEIGKVPQYLRRRQEEMAEEKRRAERPASPRAPPGFRKVDEAEKQSSLEILKTRKAEAEKAQRALPFKIETVGQQKREKELQDRLAHLDKLIGMFNKPVVFIPADSPSIAASVPPLSEGGGASEVASAPAAPWNGGDHASAGAGKGYRRPANLPRKEALAPPGGASSLSLGWG